MPETRYKSLSPKRRLLLDLIRSVRFGEIQDLKIRTGEPVLHPLPRMIRTVRFGSDSGAGPDSDNSNPVLKRQVLEMLQEFDRLQDGTIACLEIQNGLPFRMAWEESAGQRSAENPGRQGVSR